MVGQYRYTIVAQAYGQGDYGECNYNDASTCQQVPGTTTPTGGGTTSPLADTGIMVVGIITLACLLIFTALVVRLVGRRTAKPRRYNARDNRALSDERSM